MYKIEDTPTAVKDLKKIRSMSTATKNKVIKIRNVIKTEPYSNEYGGEDLKHDFCGCRSFELSKKDRVVFRIVEAGNRVEIYSYLGHYSDK